MRDDDYFNALMYIPMQFEVLFVFSFDFGEHSRADQRTVARCELLGFRQRHDEDRRLRSGLDCMMGLNFEIIDLLSFSLASSPISYFK